MQCVPQALFSAHHPKPLLTTELFISSGGTSALSLGLWMLLKCEQIYFHRTPVQQPCTFSLESWGRERSTNVWEPGFGGSHPIPHHPWRLIFHGLCISLHFFTFLYIAPFHSTAPVGLISKCSLLLQTWPQDLPLGPGKEKGIIKLISEFWQKCKGRWEPTWARHFFSCSPSLCSHKGFRSFWGMRDPGWLHRPWREPSPCTAQSLKEDMTLESLLQPWLSAGAGVWHNGQFLSWWR